MATLFDSASLALIPSGYKEDKVYSIKPTDGSGDLAFSRSNDTATRVNSSGLIEKVRTNLLTYSSEFTNAAWIKSVASGSVTAEPSELDPNGNTGTVYRFNATSGNVYQNTQATGVEYTISFYVKSGGGGNDTFRLRIGGFESSPLTATASWVRYTFTQIPASAVYAIRTDGVGTTNVLISLAQLETGDIATDYIATTSAAVSVGPVANLPRLDYSGGASCPKLLLEPQRINLVTYSEQFDNAEWTKTRASVTANAATSPDGYTNADKLVEDTTASNTHFLQLDFITVTSTTYTATIYAKAAERSQVRILLSNYWFSGNDAIYDLSAGTVLSVGAGAVSASIADVGNGWYRCVLVSGTASAGPNGKIDIRTAVAGTDSYTGDGTSGIYIWGAQLEAGAYATSYIPTLSAASTRGADAASKTGISSLIGQTEGTLFMDFVAQTTTTSQSHIWLGVVGSEIGVYGASSFQFYSSGGVNIGGGSFVTGQRYKIAFAYKANDYAAYVNGVQKGTDTSATVPATSALYINSYSDFTEIQKKEVNQAILFPTRLSNAELAALTTI